MLFPGEEYFYCFQPSLVACNSLVELESYGVFYWQQSQDMVEEKRSLPYLNCGEIIPSNLDQSPILTLLFISYSVGSRVQKVQCDREVWASILMTYLLCLLGGVVPCLEVKLLSQHNLMSWEQDAKTLPFPSPHGQSDSLLWQNNGQMCSCILIHLCNQWFENPGKESCLPRVKFLWGQGRE